MAKTIPAIEPITNPPSASLNVNQPRPKSVCFSSQSVLPMSLGAGSRNFWMSNTAMAPSQIAIVATSTSTAGIQSRA